jgi:hypothetical protein
VNGWWLKQAQASRPNPVWNGNSLKICGKTAFRLHVIPTGFVRIRHFGFLSNRNRKVRLHQCLYLLGELPQLDARMEQETTEKGHEAGIIAMQTEPSLCPVCKKGHMKPFRENLRGAAPPGDQRTLELAA